MQRFAPVVIAGALLLVAAPARATAPEDVAIQIETTSGEGPFTAIGPVCPTGTTTTPFRLTGGFQRGSGGNILVGKFTCADGSGSFFLLLREDRVRAFLGRLHVEKLHGSGSGFGTPVDDFLLDTFTGGMHID